MCRRVFRCVVLVCGYCCLWWCLPMCRLLCLLRDKLLLLKPNHSRHKPFKTLRTLANEPQILEIMQSPSKCFFIVLLMGSPSRGRPNPLKSSRYLPCNPTPLKSGRIPLLSPYLCLCVFFRLFLCICFWPRVPSTY